MVYPFSPGVSVNINTKCLVRERPKDRERLDEARKASTKRLPFGIGIPFTTFEGVPNEELQASRAPPNRDLNPKQQPNGFVAAGGPGIDGQPPIMTPSSRQARGTRRSNLGRCQGSSGVQRSSSLMSAEGPPEPAFRGQSHGQQSRHSTRDSRRSRMDPQSPQLFDQQAQSPETPANAAGHMGAGLFDIQYRQSSGSRNAANEGLYAQHGNSRPSTDSQRNRRSAREPGLQQQGGPVPQRVQDLFNEEAGPSSRSRESQRSRQSGQPLDRA